MSVALSIYISLDTAAPLFEGLRRNVTRSQLAARIGPACVELIRNNYLALPPNKMGGKSTDFWHRAALATNWIAAGDGVVITTEQIGVRLRYLGTAGLPGGVLKPVTAEYLTIPANKEAYGRTADSFENLRFVKFGRSQDALCALVQADDKRTPDGRLAQIVMFWLKKEVYQKANADILPDDEEFYDTIATAIEPLMQ